VDYRHIDCDTRKISFHQSGMSITLDGIAKGYIIDEAVAVLKEYGFYNVMVEAGGDLIGLGEKAPRTPWKIGLQSPRSGIGDFLAIFNLQDQALATSGDYMQPFTPDFSNHHILDPSSGVSSRELASASVFAPSAALADGLATALMVMGTSGLQVLEYLPGCQAYLVTKDMQVLTTPGFQTAC
jgi:thiamine biosynthesis lipoprotein